MKIEELISRLNEIKNRQYECIQKEYICGNFDDDHREVDELLLKYIDDAEVIAIFESIEKWYS